MEKTEQFLALLAKYGKDLAFFGAIIVGILGLVGVLLNIIFNRLNKRDELRHSSLVSIRNNEIKNYVSLIANSIELTRQATTLLIEDQADLKAFRKELFENQMNFNKSQFLLHTLLPAKDAKKLSEFNNALAESNRRMIDVVTETLRDTEIDINKANARITKFTNDLKPLIIVANTVTDTLQPLLRKYNGIK